MQASINPSLRSDNLRFPGQYYDSETGLHYNYFRDYDPSTGRYIQSDPIGLVGGLNTYEYAYSNSLRYVDPTGEIPLLLIIPIAGQVSAGRLKGAPPGSVVAGKRVTNR